MKNEKPSINDYTIEHFVIHDFLFEFVHPANDSKSFEFRIIHKDALNKNYGYSLSIEIPYEDGFSIADMFSLMAQIAVSKHLNHPMPKKTRR